MNDRSRHCALADIAETAERLDARCAHPWDILLACLRVADRHRRAGADLPADVALLAIGSLPALSGWEPLCEWQAPWFEAQAARDLAAGLGGEEPEHVHRARALASWLWRHDESPIAEEIVRAASEIVTRHLEAEGGDV